VRKVEAWAKSDSDPRYFAFFHWVLENSIDERHESGTMNGFKRTYNLYYEFSKVVWPDWIHGTTDTLASLKAHCLDSLDERQKISSIVSSPTKQH
jgi:hypothetical protein